ncbi:MAG: formate--phosphoribosylaminoimidazolecarboxamide ligase [Candidatus Bathyarchaeia archaeon]
MISKNEIDSISSTYDLRNLSIATICSHSALQIFHGARLEGLRSIGICTPDRRATYEAFPLARPDQFLMVENFKDLLKPEAQSKLIKENAIVIPHGSFVEYVGANNILEKFSVPMFGNRLSLLWETDRRKQKEWLTSSGLKMPKEYKSPEEIDGRIFVKFQGAKGGKGFFVADSPEEFNSKLSQRIRLGIISEEDVASLTIQEFVPGARYYPHYFRSRMENIGLGLKTTDGNLELLSIDKRIEPIDESYRGLPNIPEEFFDYTVTGNLPIVARESLIPEILDMGRCTVDTSAALFPPGLIGAFSLETIYHPSRGFTVFEISARIVAGTNLYPLGSPYSAYLFNEPMSTGRRMARELKKAAAQNALDKVVY